MADDHIHHLMRRIHRSSLLFLISSCFLLYSSSAFQFNVGGRQGWVVNPLENYNTWAGRMRFQVNDTLLFKYKKGTDSVLVVNNDDYANCNTNKPIMKFDDGNSVFKFDRSGPFYFISGNKSNCDKGQKMIIVVLAVRNNRPSPSPPPSQSPIPSAPSPLGPPSTSPSSSAPTPASLSPSPTATPPAGSPTISPSPAAQTPVPSPAGFTPGPAVTPTSSAPSSSPPSPLSPSNNTPGSPGLSPPGGGGAGGNGGSGGPTSGNTPADIRTPPGGGGGGSSAARAFTASAVLFSTVSVVLCGLVILI
ncbi:hypothetical protein M9H77_21859 [Catharanthus roseus]|uniref:Uncharacterized protein n=1 Tax=Catharanthus roseus TaxID=4058 RepID=A0ACC0ASV3_CATRO|nr:hypothetical protein M9H77_21859 [Catharanthus roseus]